jgi:hypothetical protein
MTITVKELLEMQITGRKRTNLGLGKYGTIRDTDSKDDSIEDHKYEIEQIHKMIAKTPKHLTLLHTGFQERLAHHQKQLDVLTKKV